MFLIPQMLDGIFNKILQCLLYMCPYSVLNLVVYMRLALKQRLTFSWQLI